MSSSREVFSFKAIGTQWAITTVSALPNTVRSDVLECVEQFDSTYSRFREDSLVTKIARAPAGGRFTFTARGAVLLDLYDELHRVTEGAVDPLVGHDLELLGYDPAYTLTPHADATAQAGLPRPNWREDVIRDGSSVQTNRPVLIDFGAAGKGALVDEVLAVIRRAGIDEVVVDGSGDLRHVGAEAVRVGLQHPWHPDQVIGVANLHNAALCASATNKRAWGPGLHHVIDGRTGLPTRTVSATWVMAPTTVLADGLATALFFTSPAALAHSFEFTWVRVFSDGRIDRSEDFPGQLFH